ncbi:MAG TPA: FKBP-type peptidyl-prolyl cis-trans isomerase [Allosphingosinicella sp.]|nr:FKBP-type peptidyl-prolyl cis-trans isomerase [Allosphingosinicella sp.]
MSITALLLVAAIPPAHPAAVAPPAVVTTASGLRFEVLRPGTGASPGADQAVLIRYEGRLADGTVFDRSDEPVGMLVANVVPGFAEALRMMRAGGTYRFWIPPSLAYGARGAGGVIPPDAELEFTVTLVRIGRPAPAAVADRPN